MTVTKTAFAEMAGIDPSTVTMSIRRGKLVATSDGFIDTEDPVNTIYMARRKQKGAIPSVVTLRKTKRKKKDKPIAQSPISTEPGLDDIEGLTDALQGMDDLEDLDDNDKIYDQTDKTKADVNFKLVQTKLGEFKLQLNKKQVFRRSKTEQMVAKAKQELRIRFQDLPRRITPRLTALVRSGSEDREIQSLLEREIDDGFAAFNEAMKHKDD